MTDKPLAVPPAEIRRIAFLGTPPAAVPSLQALAAGPFDVVHVVSQPDRRRGRGSKLIRSAVKQAAVELDIETCDDPSALLSSDVDLAVVVAYGRIIGRSLLEHLPMVNVHFSLLPRWRGAAPVERAILAGDRQTGVCIMAVAEGLDQGDVYASETVDIGPNETAAELTERLAGLGARLLVKTLSDGLGCPKAQDGDVTYAAKIDRSESELSFEQPAVDIDRRIRALRTWTSFRGTRLGIERARLHSGQSEPGQLKMTESDDACIVVGTSDGQIELLEVKPEGKRAMSARDWWNGTQPTEGERLG